MKSINTVSLSLLVGLLFTLLFYKTPVGLNLVILNIVLIGLSIYSFMPNLKSRLLWVLLGGQFISCIAVVYHASSFAIIINWLNLILLQAHVQAFAFKSTFSSLKQSLHALLISFFKVFPEIAKVAIGNKRKVPVFKYTRLMIAPLAIVFVFISIYATANAHFGETTNYIINGVWDNLGEFITGINFNLIILLVLGIIIAYWYFKKFNSSSYIDKDNEGTDLLSRVRKQPDSKFKMLSLLNEYKSAVILLVALNIVIGYANYLDVRYLWFNFEWDGGTLKQFVHEGTYLLIMSIFISMAITLYYFRRNLNFYKNNTFLKYLAYAWIAQNVILVISVGVRNYWYIEYFSLAYKRIGVIFFLLLCLYGLYSVFNKVRGVKSTYYLFRVNTLAVYVILLGMSVIDWDTVIVKYNLSHSKTAYVHFDFLTHLDDKTLPYLDMSDEQLDEIAANKEANFGEDKHDFDKVIFKQKINERKKDFLNQYPKRPLLAWNYRDWEAYNLLKK